MIGIGGFLLLKSGALGSILGGGASVTPQQLTANGYTDLGNGYFRSNTTGQTVYRNPSTGQIQPIGSSTIADPWLRTATQVAGAAAPGIAQGIVSGIQGLFNPNTWSGLFGGTGVPMDLGTGGAVDTGTGSLSTASPDILSGGGGAGLPPLPDLALGTPSLDFSTFLGDLPTFDYGQGSTVSLSLPDIAPGSWFSAADLAPLPDVTQIEPVDYSSWF